jgi:iron complex outermembrane receptor protein
VRGSGGSSKQRGLRGGWRRVVVTGWMTGLALLLLLSGKSARAEEEQAPADEAQPAAENAAPATGQGAPLTAEDLAGGMDEIVVTAQKREEKLQEVPISVTALPEQFIEDSQLRNFENVQQFTPNLQVQPATDSRSTAIRIRGIGTPGLNAGFDPSVGVFHDGVYLGRPGMALTELLDVARVEVLRGPQGTLYGKNTAAGAISIVTQRPHFDYEGSGEVVIGSYNDRQLRGVLNGPLWGDKLAARVAAFTVLRGGYDTNMFTGEDVNDLDRYGFRVRTLFTPGDQLEVLFTGDYSNESSNGIVADILTYEGPPSLPGVGTTFQGLAAVTGRPLPVADGFDRIVDANEDSRNDVESWGFTLEGNYTLENDHTLTSLTAYRRFESDSLLDGDFSSYRAVSLETDETFYQVSSELRFTSPSNQPLEYLGGLYMYISKDKTISPNLILKDYLDAAPLGVLFRNQQPPPPDPNAIGNVDTNDHRTYTFAGFAQATYRFTEQWSLTGGLRLQNERKTRVGSQISGCPVVNAGICGPDQFLDESREVFNASPMASLRYFLRPEIMLYVTGARGFKSGGFNQLRTLSETQTEFDDETSTSVEIGAKTQWLDRRLTLNTNFFYTWYNDFQAQSFDGTSFAVTNAGDLRSYGIESDIFAVPHPTFFIGGGVGWNVAEYESFESANCTVGQNAALAAAIDAARAENPNVDVTTIVAEGCRLPTPISFSGVQDLSGRVKDNAPEWSATVFAQYERPLPRVPFSMLGFLRAEYSYRDNFFLEQDLDPHTRQSAYNLLNLRTGVRGEDDRWEVVFSVQNVTDEEYLIAAFDVPILNGFAGVNGPPRTFSGTLRLRF